MKTRFREKMVLGAIVVIGALILLSFYFSGRLSEPSYNGLALSEWLEKAQSGDEGEQEDARRALLEIGTNGVPCLVAVLRFQDTDLQKKADRFLMDLKIFKKHALLMSPKRHSLVIGALNALAPKKDEVIEALRPYFEDPDPRVRAAAIKAVGYLPPDLPRSTNITAQLMRGLRDEAPEVRRVSAIFTKMIAHSSMSNAVPLLMDALQDPDASVRASISNALARIAPQALSVGPGP